MSASAWAAGTAISANNSVRFQPFVATAGQILFEIPPEAFSYVPGTSSLLVFQSAGAQRPGIDFVETSSSSFTMTTPVAEGTIVLAMAFVQVSSTLDALQLRDDLANGADPSKGTALVGFIQSGIGAVSQTVEEVLRDTAVSVKMFGAVGDDSTDDSAAILLAEAAAYLQGAILVFPPGIYYHTDDLTFRCATDFRDASLRYGGTGIALTLTGEKTHWNLKVTRTYATSAAAASELLYTGVRFLNCKNAALYNPYVAGFAKGMTGVSTGGVGCGYLRFFGANIINNLVSWYVNSDVTNWVNECDFFGGKFSIAETFSSMAGSRYCQLLGTPTAHKFHSVTMESTGVERKIENEGNDNQWLECYMEGNNGGTDIQNAGLRNSFSGRDVHTQVIADTGTSTQYWGSYYKRIAGGFGVDYQLVTAAGTTDISNVSTVYVDTTLGNVTLRLLPPTIVQWKGLRVTIIKTSSDANTVTIYPLPSGPSLDVLRTQYEAGGYENNGTAWYQTSAAKERFYTSASAACTGAITTAAVWSVTRIGRVVTLSLPPVQGTASATNSFEFAERLPAWATPTVNTSIAVVPIINNAANVATPGLLFVATNGAITIFRDSALSTNFTAAANAGIAYQTSASWII